MNETPFSFAPFNIVDAVYKTIDGHGIKVSAVLPRHVKPGKHPLMVRFHGGFLITGSRNFATWFPHWLGEYLLSHNCVLVNADYRLLPEACGTDILEDITSLWIWIRRHLNATIAPLGAEADLSRIVTLGESAGGYCAVQAALLHPEMDVLAVVSQFGMLDIKTPHFTQAYEKPILGSPMVSRERFDNHMDDVKAGKIPSVVSSFDPPARLPLCMSIVQHGRYADVLGPETELYPMENLERVKKVPAMWLLHGTEDTAVPVQGSKAFAAKIKQLFPKASILLTLQRGEHGFDGHESMSTQWISEGMAFVEKAWLCERSSL